MPIPTSVVDKDSMEINNAVFDPGQEQTLSTTSLSDWILGIEAEVVEAPCDTAIEARLREIGMVPGVRVRLIRTGSRIVVQVGEGRVAMRRDEASTIRVRAAHDPLGT